MLSKQQQQQQQQPQQQQEPRVFNYWQDMDLRKSVTRCGVDKCFFPSTTDPAIGYLVSGSSNLPVMREAFQLTQTLHDKFHMKHLNMEPPVLLPATLQWMHHLNTLVQQPARIAQGWPELPVYGQDADQDDLEHLVVQRVRRAPEPHLFVTTGQHNHAMTETSLVQFAPHIHNRRAFDQQWQQEIQRITQVLRAYPMFYHDFQGLVDLDGNFFVMDLDMDDKWKEQGLPDDIDDILQQAVAYLQQVRNRLWSLSS